MQSPFYQGWLDSLCGIYSIVNAHRLITNATEDVSQEIFNGIIEYLSKKKKLKSIMLEGVDHKTMQAIMKDVMTERFSSIETNKKYFYNLKSWWQYTQVFMEVKPCAVILSLGGEDNHLTTIKAITNKTILLFDSNVGEVRIAKKDCSIAGHTPDNRYVIYPTQCFYLL